MQIKSIHWIWLMFLLGLFIFLKFILQRKYLFCGIFLIPYFADCNHSVSLICSSGPYISYKLIIPRGLIWFILILFYFLAEIHIIWSVYFQTNNISCLSFSYVFASRLDNHYIELVLGIGQMMIFFIFFKDFIPLSFFLPGFYRKSFIFLIFYSVHVFIFFLI